MTDHDGDVCSSCGEDECVCCETLCMEACIGACGVGPELPDDTFGKVTLDDLRKLPDGSLTREEVNLLIDYIEKLEDRLLSHPHGRPSDG